MTHLEAGYREVLSQAEELAALDKPELALSRLLAAKRSAPSALVAMLFDCAIASHELNMGRRPTAPPDPDAIAEFLKAGENSEPRLLSILEFTFHSFIGVSQVESDPKTAAESLSRAAAFATELGDEWPLARTECNLAIAFMGLFQWDKAQSMLNRALERSQSCRLSPAVRARFSRTVEINQVGLRTTQHSSLDSLADLLIQRDRVQGDTNLLATLDLNVAETYLRLGRFGSALSAAESASELYQSLGGDGRWKRSEVVRLTCLVKLRQLEGVEEELILIRAADGARAEPWWYQSQDTLDEIYRLTGRFADEATSSEFVRHGGTTPLDDFEELMTILLSELIAVAQGDAPTRLDASLRLLSSVEASMVEVNIPVASLRAVWEIVYFGHTAFDFNSEEKVRLESLGLDPFMLRDLQDMFDAFVNDEPEKGLAVALRSAVNEQRLIARQESERDRAWLGLSKYGTLSDALGKALALGRYGAIFELLEFSRRDISESVGNNDRRIPTFQSALHLSPRPQLSSEKFMAAPGFMFVGGRSELHEVSYGEPPIADADSIREELAGSDSAWLSLRLVGKKIVWGMIRNGKVLAGSRPIDSHLVSSLRRHSHFVTLTIDQDVNLAGDDAPRWVVPTLSLARVASSEMLDEEDLLAACLEAVPAEIALRFKRKNRPERDLERLYSDLGAQLLPLELRESLASGEVPHLLISIPPELATIPMGLLGTVGEGRLFDRTVTLAPPSGLATRLANRAWSQSTQSLHMVVLDSADDLECAADLRQQFPHALTGWSAATSYRGVATRSNVITGLASIPTDGRSTVSFVGHANPGRQDSPSSASISVAGKNLGEQSEVITANEIASIDLRGVSHVYLGACEGTGFGTGLEWSSVAAGFLAAGARGVSSHAWPIHDGLGASRVDRMVISAMGSAANAGSAVCEVLRRQYSSWVLGEENAAAPHYWAGMSVVGVLSE